MRKIYVFNNYYYKAAHKAASANIVRVEASTILEAKEKVKEMGYEGMEFVTIKLRP